MVQSLYKQKQLLRKLLFLISFVSLGITLLSNEQYDSVPFLFTLPLSYIFFLFITKDTFTKKWGLALSIIELVIFLRYVIIPILWSTNQQYNGLVVANADYNGATLLIAYELFILSFFFNYLVHRLCINESQSILNPPLKINKLTPYLLIGLFLIIVATNSRLRNTLFIFTITSREDLGLKDGETLADYYNENVSGIFKIFFYIGRLVLFNYSLLLINKLNSLTSKYKILLSIIICILYISCIWSGGVGISRWNIIIGLLLSSSLLMTLYPYYINKIRKVSTILIFVTIILGSMVKIMTNQSRSTTISETLTHYVNAELFDEYFSGIGAVANGMRVVEVRNSDKSFERMFVDCLNTFPYVQKILGLNDIKPTAKLYHEVTGYQQLIMPNITISLFQFGWIFSPIYSILLLYLALFFNQKLEKTSSIYEKSFLLICTFWCSLFMGLNVNIINSNLVAPIIGYIIFSLTSQKSNPFYEKNINNNSRLQCR